MSDISSWFKQLTASMANEGSLSGAKLNNVAPSIATDNNTVSAAAPAAHLEDMTPSMAPSDNTPSAAAPVAHLEDMAPSMATDNNTPSAAATEAHVANSIQVGKRKPRNTSVNVMGKTQLIEIVAKTADLKKTQAGRAVNALLAAMQEALAEGEDVGLPGFGVFWTEERKERIARNPQTGERINIPERRVVNFKAGQKLKSLIIGLDKIQKDL